MSSNLSPAEANNRLTLLRESLQKLCAIYPDGLLPTEFIQGNVPKNWTYKIVNRLLDLGYIVPIPTQTKRSNKYVAVIDKMRDITNDEKLSMIIWPSAPPPAVEVQNTDTLENENTSLPPPPPLEGVKKPPSSASPEIVQEWIFTLLHAQTENIIYIRERLDKCLKLLEPYEPTTTDS